MNPPAPLPTASKACACLLLTTCGLLGLSACTVPPENDPPEPAVIAGSVRPGSVEDEAPDDAAEEPQDSSGDAALASDSSRVALPEATLSDPRQKEHALRELSEPKGLILVVTAPTLSNEDAQNAWSEALQAGIDAERGRVVFLEDMSVSWFADTARERMAEEMTPGEDPLLLLDEEGEVARGLGVAEEATVAFAFDAQGRVRAKKTEASAAAAEALWSALAE